MKYIIETTSDRTPELQRTLKLAGFTFDPAQTLDTERPPAQGATRGPTEVQVLNTVLAHLHERDTQDPQPAAIFAHDAERILDDHRDLCGPIDTLLHQYRLPEYLNVAIRIEAAGLGEKLLQAIPKARSRRDDSHPETDTAHVRAVIAGPPVRPRPFPSAQKVQ